MTDDEFAEAEGLVEIADLLSLLELRAMTSEHVPASIQRWVRERTAECCEYCRATAPKEPPPSAPSEGAA